MKSQELEENLPPVWQRQSSDWLVDLASRLKAVEEGKSDNVVAIEIWHQVILLARAELVTLQPQQLDSASLFSQDYYAWVQEQIRLLHLQQLERLDLEHLPDELHDLVWLIEREIEQNLEIVCNHLLKYKYAKEYLSNEPCCDSWRTALSEARRKISRELEESPSLQNYPAQELDFQYQLAVDRVYRETKLPNDTLPKNCPWTIDQILNPDWLPDQSQ